MIVLFLSVAALAAPCEEFTSTLQLTAALKHAEKAYADMDAEAFFHAQQDVFDVVDCLSEPLDAQTAARVHQMEGLVGYITPDPLRAQAGFAAARHADPDLELSSRFAGKGHPLRGVFDEATGLAEQIPIAVDVPQQAILTVDAEPQETIPAERPSVLQLMDAEGVVLDTEYHRVSAPLPEWLLTEPVDVFASAPEIARRRRVRTRRTLWISAGATALVAGGLYGTAYVMGQRYDDPSNPNIETRSDLDTLKQQTNALAYTSFGVGGAAVVLGTAAAIDLRPGIRWSTTW